MEAAEKENWPRASVTFVCKETRASAAVVDILALKHVSRILGHCKNLALPFSLVFGHGISCCSMLKYRIVQKKELFC